MYKLTKYTNPSFTAIKLDFSVWPLVVDLPRPAARAGTMLGLLAGVRGRLEVGAQPCLQPSRPPDHPSAARAALQVILYIKLLSYYEICSHKMM